MPLPFSNAITIAQIELNKIQRFGNSYALLPEHGTETPYGWLIPWAQSDFRATKEVRLAVNAPFFVNRSTGEVLQLSFREYGRLEEWLLEYAEKHGYNEKSV
jgi:hypothetical protein